jgi:hypothetical protein
VSEAGLEKKAKIFLRCLQCPIATPLTLKHLLQLLQLAQQKNMKIKILLANKNTFFIGDVRKNGRKKTGMLMTSQQPGVLVSTTIAQKGNKEPQIYTVEAKIKPISLPVQLISQSFEAFAGEKMRSEKLNFFIKSGEASPKENLEVTYVNR